MPKTTKESTKKLNSKASSTKKKASSKTVDKKNKITSKATTSKNTKKAKTTVSKKNTSTKKTPSKKKTVSKKAVNNSISVLEYYDLPYRYNQTVIKMLYQTPKTLFVYWDISDEDKNSYIKTYGEKFFENTKPVLIIHNETMNYSLEIEINDFANCWYFNINDEKCKYSVEIGRRPKENNNIIIPNNYLNITYSNKIESPNGHILFEKNQKVVFYRNVKTNQTFSKDIANFSFMKYFGKVYNSYNMYKKLYKQEEFLQGPNNPTSY